MASGEGKTRRKQWGGGRLERCADLVVRTAALLSSLEVPPVHVSCAFLVSSPQQTIGRSMVVTNVGIIICTNQT